MGDEVKTTDALIVAFKCGEYDGVDIMQAWCRLRQQQERIRELEKDLRIANQNLDMVDLIKRRVRVKYYPDSGEKQ